MELRQLECLVAVADAASFTRGAEALRLAQPGVSAHVRRLEAELGVRLLDRGTDGVRPTAVGEAVLVAAREALRGATAVRDAVARAAGLLEGRVRIGALAGSSHAALDAAVARFHEAHPGVRLELREGPSDRLRAAVRDGEIDVALLGTHDADPADDALATDVVWEGLLVAAVASGDPLEHRSTVPLATLVERELLCVPRPGAVREALDAACAAAGIAAQVVAEAAEPRRLVGLAAHGLGVAVVPDTAVTTTTGVVGVPIARPTISVRIVLVSRAAGPDAPAGVALLAALREALVR